MKEIGGYFGTELMVDVVQRIPHYDGVFVNTGQNALSLILQSFREVRHVFLPSYCCTVIKETLQSLHISFTLYRIDINFELVSLPTLKDGEFIIAINYFGIKDSYIKQLLMIYGERLIVDNAHAFYAEHYQGIDTFYSIRKYFGVPDGGIAYVKEPRLDIINNDDSMVFNSHQILRDKGGAEAGFSEFRRNELLLGKQPLSKISQYSATVLRKVPFEHVKNIRLRNFNFLHSKLAETNHIAIPDSKSFRCPMIYPYYSCISGLREKLIQEKIYVATYWPEFLEQMSENSVEYRFAKFLLPLPVDQRYGEEDMQRIIDVILN